MDSAALEIVSPARCKTGAGRTVAEIRSIGTRQQGEDQKYHERPVQPRHSLGMGNTQSHHPGTAECQTQKDSDRSDNRANQGLLVSLEGAVPYCGVAWCVKRSESRRTARPQMGGRKLRVVRSECRPCGGQAEDHALQNGSLTEANSWTQSWQRFC